MQTENINNHWYVSGVQQSILARISSVRLALVIAVALFAGVLAYTTPPAATLNVGWLGDQFFLSASEGLGQGEAANGRWFADELTDTSPTRRSRWMRERAFITLPGLDTHRDLTLVMLVQGWPANTQTAASQPTVTVVANGVSIGRFQAATDWAEHQLTIPASAIRRGDLHLELRSVPTFSSPDDGRQKGARVAQIRVVPPSSPNLELPPIGPLVGLALIGILVYMTVGRMARQWDLALILAVLFIAAGALALAVARIWMVVLLPWLVVALGLALVFAHARPFRAWLVIFVNRCTHAVVFNACLLIAPVAWVMYLLISGALALHSGAAPAISWPQLLLGLSALALLVFRPLRVARLAHILLSALHTRRIALTLLGLFLAAWLGYETYLIATLPGVGHADYSDNAVVARNLMQGRGWVVDYVTQFYKLYDGLTRPQETWPLLQPVWIAPFFMLFGPTDWAAKLPNLIFTGLLGLLVYLFGARIWDRRIGLTATVVLLTSHLFLRLVINVTSDLGFVLLSFFVLSLVYVWGQSRAVANCGAEQIGSADLQDQSENRPTVFLNAPLHLYAVLLLGVLTGLMLLQKPSNGIFLAVGIGIWLLICVLYSSASSVRRVVSSWREHLQALVCVLAPLALWAAIAATIFLPYVVRNWTLSRQSDHIYGSLAYSTESRDTWIWGYAPDTDFIYQVYTPEGELSETKGLPDRSWILRWGFDRTLAKMTDQIRAIRDYLVPTMSDLPILNDIFSSKNDDSGPHGVQREDKRLFFAAGSWLTLLGLLIVLRRRPSMVGLLVLTFVPYISFLAVYWHANEPRYFVAMMPWLALFVAVAIWWLVDRLSAVGTGRLASIALIVALALSWQVVSPSIPAINKVLFQWDYADGDREAYAWLKANTPADAAIMTRVPWQLNWHSERSALMIPATINRKHFFQIARYYNIRYLVMDVTQRPMMPVQKMLDQLVKDPNHLFKPVYSTPKYLKGETKIYEFPADYGGVPELRL